MAEWQDKKATIGKMRLHYLDWGTKGKPTMLLLHGGGQSAHSWDEFSRAMRRDYHVIALDQRGHGDSAWSKNGTYTLAAHQQDIHGFVTKLNLRNITLIGLSMGGRNSYVYASKHPERIKRLVIVDVAPDILKKGGRNIQRFTSKADILPSLEAFVERAHKFNPRRPLEQLRERLSHHLRKVPDGRWTWKYDTRFRGSETKSMRKKENLWPAVRRIKAPTLIVRGEVSDILSPSQARRLQKAIKGSHLVEIANAGHTVNGDNPQAFTAAVQSFLMATDKNLMPAQGQPGVRWLDGFDGLG
ncbi:MAG: alpha/beta hydrolase [Chloroflexi bacterium]|nr:alpha/beta hydrolase [Chloroflexota bacterium]